MNRRAVKAEGKPRQGQPLVVLALVMAGWTLMRATTWAMPTGVEVLPSGPTDRQAARTVSPAEPLPYRVPMRDDRDAPALPGFADPSGWRGTPPPAPLPSFAAPRVASDGPKGTASAKPALQPVAPRLATGHSLLMLAGFSQMRVPPEVAAYFSRATLPAPAAASTPALVQATSVPAAPPAATAASAGRSRWSGDGWVLWRDDTTTPITSGRPSYGRSQMGAVVRYALAPRSGHRPQAYLRGSAALQGARERELAAGLSARPLARVPLRVAAELRAGDRASGTTVRPAAYAVTELAPRQLPGGLVAEAYVQGGYVGGRDRTAFVDGQVRVDRSLAGTGDFDLRAGAAAWGGAQREGARLDVGPSASLAFRVGDARGRVAADYRFRVAGDAEPASGPALTLSAGF